MKNSLRITGGELKGKKIPFDFKSSLRPTSSKLREVLFNWLQFDIKDFQCLDVFAGTGALGIEALSRGAKKTVFIELNKKNYLALKECISKFNLMDQSMLLFRDGLSWIKENDLSIFDLILLDPPFNQDYEKKILELLYMNKNLKSSCKIYIEYSKFSDIELPDSFEIIKEKIIGDVKALLIKIK
jgi:16S rRNA (guanine966-N2)-methyltransferase